MRAKELYNKLYSDFDIAHLKDDWSFMRNSRYISPSFRKISMGLVLDHTREIKKVYTATIPDTAIFEQLIASGETDIMLFSHHAMGYDPTLEGFPFYDAPEEILEKLKQQRISLYVLHAPLDKNGEYSTSVNLARSLGIQIVDEFCEYEGIKCGVICQTDFINALELAEQVKKVVGHEVRLILNGEEIIRDGKVAIAAGGGSVDFAAREIAELGINMYITGCTREVPAVHTIREFHRIISEEKINVIGATHYSTEKYACMAMVSYFKKLGLPAEFLDGRYFLEDL
jgi:putative NIF3 family GTP cyclohydrolase 1 type 2